MRLVLSAGGQMGIAYIGAIRSLENHYKCRKLSEVFTSFEGTSSGALCAFLLSLGLSSLELLFYYQQVSDYSPNFVGLTTQLGLATIESISKSVLTTVMKRKGIENVDTITFDDFSKKTGVKTVIGMTIIGPDEEKELDASHETVPDWPILPCLMSSMAIPGIFEPVCITIPTGIVYAVDGAISNSFRFPQTACSLRTIGILLIQKPKKGGFSPTTHNVWNYLNFICERFFHYLALSHAKDKLPGVIPIYCESTGMVCRPDSGTIHELLQCGQQTCDDFFNKNTEY